MNSKIILVFHKILVTNFSAIKNVSLSTFTRILLLSVINQSCLQFIYYSLLFIYLYFFLHLLLHLFLYISLHYLLLHILINFHLFFTHSLSLSLTWPTLFSLFSLYFPFSSCFHQCLSSLFFYHTSLPPTQFHPQEIH